MLTRANFGSLTCTPARRPVPRLLGQVRMYPRYSFHMNSQPLPLISSSTLFSPSEKRLKTRLMLPPFSMEMTRVWSSSLIQTRKFFWSLCLKYTKKIKYMCSFDFYYAMPDRTLKRLRLDLIEVTVPFGKL